MKRQSEQEMRDLYREWLSSGKSKSEFADSVGMVRTTFYYWTKKFSTEEGAPPAGNGFHLLDTGPAVGRGRVMAHIHYPSGVCIELFEGVPAEYLKALLG
jgi:hypothetical protein